MSESCKEKNLERSHHKKKNSVTVYGDTVELLQDTVVIISQYI